MPTTLTRLEALERLLHKPDTPRCELRRDGTPHPSAGVGVGWCGKRSPGCRCAAELAVAPPQALAHWIDTGEPGGWAATHGRGWRLHRALLREVFARPTPDERRDAYEALRRQVDDMV